MIALGLLGRSRAKLAKLAWRLALEAAGGILMIGSNSGVKLATEAGMTITGAQVKAARSRFDSPPNGRELEPPSGGRPLKPLGAGES
jgi:hypothetical protein